MATPGDLVKQIQTNANASAADAATTLVNLQAFVNGAVSPKQARVAQITNADLPAANTILADCTNATPQDTQGMADANKLIADLNAESTALTAAIAALNALLPTS